MSTPNYGTEAVVILRAVRMSYCHLFKRGVFRGKEEDKFSCVLLLDNDINAAAIRDVNKVIQEVLEEKNKSKPLPADKYCMRDGQFKDGEEYRNSWFISAKTEAPRLIGKDKEPVTKEQGLIYSGCYVNASISMWFQDNEDGRRVNCQLRVVQHHSHGDALGGGMPTQVELDRDMQSLDFEEYIDPEDDL